MPTVKCVDGDISDGGGRTSRRMWVLHPQELDFPLAWDGSQIISRNTAAARALPPSYRLPFMENPIYVAFRLLNWVEAA